MCKLYTNHTQALGNHLHKPYTITIQIIYQPHRSPAEAEAEAERKPQALAKAKAEAEAKPKALAKAETKAEAKAKANAITTTPNRVKLLV